MESLFYIIRDNEDWEPDKTKEYTETEVEELKSLADEWFDILNSQGEFFHDYNEVLYRIDLLRKKKNKRIKK